MGADNQQETSPSPILNFYYSGFCAGEMSCSIIKASDKTGRTYYTPDFTVSNQDLALLRDSNRVIGQGKGVLSPVKGGYNLSFRGQAKVKIALDFFDRFPIIAGDLANTRLHILQEAIGYIGRKQDCPSTERTSILEKYRAELRELKRAKLHVREFKIPSVNDEAIGYFLAGVVDAEGTVGLRRRDRTYQPFFAVAMKDYKIVKLLHDFLGYGYIYYRPGPELYHYETGSFRHVLHAIALFTDVYPSQHQNYEDVHGEAQTDPQRPYARHQNTPDPLRRRALVKIWSGLYGDVESWAETTQPSIIRWKVTRTSEIPCRVSSDAHEWYNHSSAVLTMSSVKLKHR